MLELRWTWMPYWLVVSPAFQRDVERQIQDAVLLNGLPQNDAALDRIEDFTLRCIERRFPIPGLRAYVAALRNVEEP